MFRRLSEQKLQSLRETLARETNAEQRETLRQEISLAEAALRLEQKIKDRTRP